jgi:hydroxypyruvate isomerase
MASPSACCSSAFIWKKIQNASSPRPAEAIEIVRAVNHPQVQFLYDIFHEQMGYGNLIEKLDNHIDVIGLIHIADVPGRHQPGSGEIDYGNIYRKLAQLNYRHAVAMEFLPPATKLPPSAPQRPSR